MNKSRKSVDFVKLMDQVNGQYPDKRWCTSQGMMSAWLGNEFASPALTVAFRLDELEVALCMNQNFTLKAWVAGEWEEVAVGKTDGSGQTGEIPLVTAHKFRLTLGRQKDSPRASELHLDRAEQKSLYEIHTDHHLDGGCIVCRRGGNESCSASAPTGLQARVG